MKTPKIVILSLAALVILAMILFVSRLLARKLKSTADDGIPPLSYAAWFIPVFAAGVVLACKSISLLEEVLEIIFNIQDESSLQRAFSTGSLLCGFTIAWLLLWYFCANALSVIVSGKRNTAEEAQSGNIGYFAVRGAIFIGLIASLLPAFELILRLLMPRTEIPFFH